MREIEFRGKNKCDNNWHYGYLVYEPIYSSYKITQGKEISDFVEENTIGEYTGLKDKNGTKIFEGDIVIADFDYKKEPMEVIYYKCGFKLKSKNCKEVYDYSIHDETPELEVIGNIHDNPELLGGD